MSWKSNWGYLSGDLKVTVKVIDRDERYRTFDFTCYVSDELHSLDRKEYLESAVRALGLLRGYYRMGIIDIKKIRGAKDNEKVRNRKNV